MVTVGVGFCVLLILLVATWKIGIWFSQQAIARVASAKSESSIRKKPSVEPSLVAFYTLTPVMKPLPHTSPLPLLIPADAFVGVPNYALKTLTTTTPAGFASISDGITVLYVIRNLQMRLAEMEARLESAGLIVAKPTTKEES